MHGLTFTAGLIAAAASLTSAAPTPGSYGSVTVTNNCNFPVYIMHVDQNGQFNNQPYAPGSTYSEPMFFQGVSLKFTKDGNIYAGNENELGYSWVQGDNLYWTWGENGTPFKGAGGFKVVPSVQNGNCNTLSCPAGDASCAGVASTRACPLTTNLSVSLCSA